MAGCVGSGAVFGGWRLAVGVRQPRLWQATSSAVMGLEG